MKFEYEITADEYVASELLCHRLSGGRKRVERSVYWLLAGFILVAVALNEWSHNWAPFLVALTGALCSYSGVVSFFPARFFRRAYPSSEVVGKKFKADVTEDGFEVTGDLCSWRVLWPGVRFKAENDQVFMLYSHGTIFMFGKKYLDNEQQQHLGKLSGLT